MNRRSLLTVAALIVAGGCTAVTDDDTPRVEDPGTDPSEYLPDEGDGWSIESASSWGIGDALGPSVENDVIAEYTGPDGGEYRVAIVQWSNDDVDGESIDHKTAEGDTPGDLAAMTATGLFAGFVFVSSGDRGSDLTDRSDLFQSQE